MGYSKAEVELVDDNGIFVRKSGDISRNLERYDVLSHLGIKIPIIYEVLDTHYNMEYIPNLDMKTYLATNQTNEIIKFIRETIDKLSEKTIEMSFVEVYRTKLSENDFTKYNLPFTIEELIGKLPEYLPYSEYHGDFTLENVLYNTQKNEFVLIDPLTTVYSSFVFDLAKLRQDLQCKWFIRNDSVYLDSKLQSIIDGLKDYPHFNNDYILILMLMRVLPYTRNETDEKFLIDEIKKLWK